MANDRRSLVGANQVLGLKLRAVSEVVIAAFAWAEFSMAKLRLILLLGLTLGLVSSSFASVQPPVRLDVDWPNYLAQHDLSWDRMPQDYFEGAFVGNGLFGAILFQDDLKPNTLRFEIGRADVYDHRTDGTRLGHARIRLPIGQLLLTPVGTVTKTTLRTDLWNAEVRGTLETNAGTLTFRCFVPSGESVIVVNLRGSRGAGGLHVSSAAGRQPAPRRAAEPRQGFCLHAQSALPG